MRLRKFKLIWKNGETNIVHGKNIADALTRHKISVSAIRDLETYEELHF